MDVLVKLVGKLVFGTHEPAVQRAFALLARPGMAFYDVGANVGFYCVIARRLVVSGGKPPGSRRGIINSPWDACVIARPAECEDLAPALRELAQASCAG